jgi:hypothetical protein
MQALPVSLNDILDVISSGSGSEATKEKNVTLFTERFNEFVKTTITNMMAYAEADTENPELALHEVLQKPSNLAPGFFGWVPLGVLFDQLELTTDQNPVSPKLVRALFDNPQTGLFSVERVYQDIDILVPSDNIDDDGEIIDVAQTYLGGGRHRLSAVALILDAGGYDLGSEEVRSLLWRCTVKDVTEASEVAFVQQLLNTTRSMGRTEKERVKQVSKGVDVESVEDLLRAAYVATKADERTASYRNLFAYAMPNRESEKHGLETETLGSIGSSFYSALKSAKLDKDVKELVGFSKKVCYEFDSHITPIHESILNEAWRLLPSVIEQRVKAGNGNIARDVAQVAKTLVKDVLVNLDLQKADSSQ